MEYVDLLEADSNLELALTLALFKDIFLWCVCVRVRVRVCVCAWFIRILTQQQSEFGGKGKDEVESLKMDKSVWGYVCVVCV